MLVRRRGLAMASLTSRGSKLASRILALMMADSLMLRPSAFTKKEAFLLSDPPRLPLYCVVS